MPIVNFSSKQTKLSLTKKNRADAISSAFRVTMSPIEWEWSRWEQQNMARALLWFHQRLGAIEELARGTEIQHQDESVDQLLHLAIGALRMVTDHCGDHGIEKSFQAIQEAKRVLSVWEADR